MLQVRGMSVKLGDLTILRRLSLEVPARGRVGLVGRNGAGKTTTLRSIMGLIPAVSEGITLGGEDVSGLSAHGRARYGIGYMPEDRRLISTLTVQENILMPAWAVGIRDPSERLTAIYRLLPEVKALASRSAAQLSGGQQKLVALARSFINARQLLLLDEPFEGIATAFAQKLADAIRRFQDQQEGLAVLVAESDLKRARLLAQKIYVIERGEIMQED